MSVYGTAELHRRNYSPAVRADFPGQFGSNGTLLGVNRPGGLTGISWVPGAQRGHALAFGQTGSGKGAAQIVPMGLSYSGSMLLLDAKDGENTWLLADRRRQMGQQVEILDPFNAVNKNYGSKVGVTETATSYNPLALLNPDAESFNDDLDLIGQALIVSSTGERDPYFTDSARELVNGLNASLIERKGGPNVTLGDLRKLLTASEADLLAYIEMILRTAPDSLGARKLARFGMDAKDIRSIKSTAVTQTSFLDSPPIRSALQTPARRVDFRDLARSKMTVFVVLPGQQLDNHGRWFRLVLSQAIAAVAEVGGPSDLPVVLLADEMGTVGPLPILERAFGLLGGRGLRVLGCPQDLGQLQRYYPHSWSTFIANSEVITVLNANDLNTLEYFSKLGGTTTVTEKGTGPNASTHHYARAVITPDELRRIGEDQVMIFRAGRNPILLQKVYYFRENRFFGLYRPDPRYPPPQRAPEPPAWQQKLSNWWDRQSGQQRFVAVLGVILAIVLLLTHLKWLLIAALAGGAYKLADWRLKKRPLRVRLAGSAAASVAIVAICAVLWNTVDYVMKPRVMSDAEYKRIQCLDVPPIDPVTRRRPVMPPGWKPHPWC
jgi:type IV secretion system protein VirD4